jgi:hypothetical protein
MNPDYILACGIVWRKTADSEAGLELLEALDSPDLGVRAMARVLLIDGKEDSMRLLENGLASGVVSPETAGECMVEILRNRQLDPPGKDSGEWSWTGPSLC